MSPVLDARPTWLRAVPICLEPAHRGLNTIGSLRSCPSSWLLVINFTTHSTFHPPIERLHLPAIGLHFP